MKIFFTCSFRGRETYRKDIDMVIEELKQYPVELIGTELGNYIDLLPKHLYEKYKENPKKLHYAAVRHGILEADAVVMEMSQQSFQLGYEAAFTVQTHKHILCLSLFEDYSQRINNEFFHAKKYNKYTLSDDIAEFMSFIQKEKLSNRFNMFLSDRQLSYLEEAAIKEGITMSEYLRQLLEEDKQYIQKKHN